jgi:hypothetical protein
MGKLNLASDFLQLFVVRAVPFRPLLDPSDIVINIHGDVSREGHDRCWTKPARQPDARRKATSRRDRPLSPRLRSRLSPIRIDASCKLASATLLETGDQYELLA